MNRWILLTGLTLCLPKFAGASLAEDLASPSWFVRLSAVESLMRMTPEREDVGPVVLNFMAEPDPAVREVVMASLSRWKLDRQTTFLVLAEALQDPDPSVRRTAVDMAGSLGTQAYPLRSHLEALLKDPSEDVRPYAALALAILERY